MFSACVLESTPHGMGVNLAMKGNQGSSPGDENLVDDDDNETSFFGSIKQNGQVQVPSLFEN